MPRLGGNCLHHDRTRSIEIVTATENTHDRVP
jgi:hypothetical protein